MVAIAGAIDDPLGGDHDRPLRDDARARRSGRSSAGRAFGRSSSEGIDQFTFPIGNLVGHHDHRLPRRCGRGDRSRPAGRPASTCSTPCPQADRHPAREHLTAAGPNRSGSSAFAPTITSAGSPRVLRTVADPVKDNSETMPGPSSSDPTERDRAWTQHMYSCSRLRRVRRQPDRDRAARSGSVSTSFQPERTPLFCRKAPMQ